jgi:hypothetical protein
MPARARPVMVKLDGRNTTFKTVTIANSLYLGLETQVKGQTRLEITLEERDE